MNWAQFTDPISHMCLAGAVVACQFLTLEVAGWQVRVLLMSIFFVTEFAEFSEKHLGKTPLLLGQLLALIRNSVVQLSAGTQK